VRRAGHADRTDHLARVVAHGGADAAQPLLEFLEIGGIPPFPDERDLLDEIVGIDSGALREAGKFAGEQLRNSSSEL